VMLPFEGVSGAVLAIDKSEIEAHACAHFHYRWSRRFNYKSV